MDLITTTLTTLATFIFVATYAFNGAWQAALTSLALGLLWLAGQGRGWLWPAAAGLAGFAALAAWGVWRDAGAPWMVLGLVAALAAWDQAHFWRRLKRARKTAGEPGLKQAHRQRLLIVVALGLLLGEGALLLRLELSLGWALLLGALIIFGLSRTVTAIRGRNS